MLFLKLITLTEFVGIKVKILYESSWLLREGIYLPTTGYGFLKQLRNLQKW